MRRAVRRGLVEREADAVGKGELSIVPLLDVIVNLVVFLLTTTAMVSLASEVSAATPPSCPGCGGSRVARGLELTVVVTDQTIRLAGSSGRLAPGCDRFGGTTPTILRDGHEWDALRACAQRVHAAYPDEREVRLGADPLVPYEDVVRAMDALRSEGEAPLFPEILLSAGVR